MIAHMEVDIYTDIEEKGVSKALYIGDCSDPALDSFDSWEELIQQQIGYYILPDGTMHEDSLETLERIVAAMKQATKQFKQELKIIRSRSEVARI